MIIISIEGKVRLIEERRIEDRGKERKRTLTAIAKHNKKIVKIFSNSIGLFLNVICILLNNNVLNMKNSKKPIYLCSTVTFHYQKKQNKTSASFLSFLFFLPLQN